MIVWGWTISRFWTREPKRKGETKQKIKNKNEISWPTLSIELIVSNWFFFVLNRLNNKWIKWIVLSIAVFTNFTLVFVWLIKFESVFLIRSIDSRYGSITFGNEFDILFVVCTHQNWLSMNLNQLVQRNLFNYKTNSLHSLIHSLSLSLSLLHTFEVWQHTKRLSINPSIHSPIYPSICLSI